MRPTLPARSRTITCTTYTPAGTGRPPERPFQVHLRRPPGRLPFATSFGSPASVRSTRKRVLRVRLIPRTLIAMAGGLGPTTWPGEIETTRGRGGAVSSVISRGTTTERPWWVRLARTR